MSNKHQQSSANWEVKPVFAGANMDTEADYVGVEKGDYLDAKNMRTTKQGNAGALVKIKGEEIKYPNIDNRCISPTSAPIAGDWLCIGSTNVKGHLVEFWVETAEGDDPIIRIDGVIVGQSPEMPWVFNDSDPTRQFPIQLDKNESCVGGEVYITDFNTPPMIFNIQDILDNSDPVIGCTLKYFDNFNPEEFTINMEMYADHPIFLQMVNAGAGAGLAAGMYQYSIRYNDATGNFTNFSYPTPYIPVVVQRGSESTCHPYAKTFGRDADPTNIQNYGIKIRFRITNLNNYKYIEIKRARFNLGTWGVMAPVEELVYKIEITNQEIDYIDFTDMVTPYAQDSSGDSRGISLANLPFDITQDQLVNQTIEAAKGIRYLNNRLYLGNIKYASMDIEDEIDFIDSSGIYGFPVVENLGNAGMKKEWNTAYRKPYIRGEKYGFGFLGIGAAGERSMVEPITDLDNYRMPERREGVEAGSDTQIHSLDLAGLRGTTGGNKALPIAAWMSGTVFTQDVGYCYEMFDLRDAVTQNLQCDQTDNAGRKSFKNIIMEGSRDKADVTTAPDCTTIDSSLLNGVGTKVTADRVGYQPFHPVHQNDPDARGLDYRPNTEVYTGSSWTSYDPKGFSPNYYTLGMGIYGVDPDTLPAWIKAFAVTRTKPAQRVVAQGIAIYKLKSGDFHTFSPVKYPMEKERNKFWVYCPDFDEETGYNTSALTNMLASPTSYKIQFVSPLGFFSQMYDAEFDTGDIIGTPEYSRLVDLITYARMLSDNQAAYEINPLETAFMGISDGATTNRYVAYSKFRNQNFLAGSKFTNGDARINAGIDPYHDPAIADNLQSFTIQTATMIQDNPSTTMSRYLEIGITDNIYDNTGPVTGQDFEDVDLQDWAEPFYIVNIIQDLDVQTQNVDKYIETEAYIKKDAIIGQGSGVFVDRTMRLIDERWEDCIPDLDASNSHSTDEVFVYVGPDLANLKAWVNVTYMAAGTITGILDDIVNFGFWTAGDGTKCYGVYKHNIIAGASGSLNDKGYELLFNYFNTLYPSSLFRPDITDFIHVKYSNRLPIRVFGGDGNIGEAIFSPLFREGDKGGNSGPGTVAERNLGQTPNNFIMYAGMPYWRYHLNQRIFTLARTRGANKIQDKNKFSLTWIRQWAVMFGCESRTPLHYGYNIDLSTSTYDIDVTLPITNYIMRAHRWSTSHDLAGNNIYEAYGEDYPNEFPSMWKYGGFRFKPQINFDYIHDRVNYALNILSKPKVGFQELTHFCVRTIWSVQRMVNQFASPGLNTFPTLNVIDIDDDTGPIKRLWSADSDKGNNIYAFTENGTCLLLTDKTTVANITGTELALTGMAETDHIKTTMWISKEIGMNDEMWRASAEFNNKIWFTNKKSAYSLFNNEIKDIGRLKYHKKLYPAILSDIADGGLMDTGYITQMTAYYDVLYNEYWVRIADVVLVFNELNQAWNGEYSYNHDQYMNINNKTFGVRDLETYDIDKGYLLEGNPYEAWCLNVVNENQPYSKEFIRIRINNSNDNKPTSIEFYDGINGTLLASMDVATFGANYIVDYGKGWEQYIPRKTAYPFDRMQGLSLIYKIIHNLEESFKITNIQSQYKILK